MKLNSLFSKAAQTVSTDFDKIVDEAKTNSQEVENMYNPKQEPTAHSTQLNMVAHDLTGEQY